MSYKLNGTDIYTTYGIRAGHALGSNIAMRGVFDMPQRTGTTYKDWGDADGVEPWVNAGEMFFAGRDINFSGFIVGADVALNAAVSGFYAAIDSATGISVFETPYNSASGYVKSVVPRYMNGGCFIDMVFREPVVALTGTLPASGSSVAYMIDNIPFSSFGLYLSKPDGLHNLSEPKEQFFTQYGQEGYQIVKRKHKTLEMNGFVMGTSLSDFTSKIQSLYKVFSSSGTRTIVLNTITTVECFATEGFKVSDVHYSSSGVIARFNINLIIKNVTYYAVPLSYPVCLDDANHWWYDATDLTTITQDGSNLVSVGAAKGGATTGKNLLQATGTKQPLWVTPGTIRFDGVDNFLKSAAFTWNQPEFIYILFKQITWTSIDRIFDGNANNGGSLYQFVSSPNLRFYAGGATALPEGGEPNFALNTWGIARVLFNGADSKFIIDNNTPVTGNPGTNNMGGLTLGKIGTSENYYGNFEVKDIVCVDIDDAANETEIYNWLVTRIPT
jgi:hypothetical protein